jgi:hypothetical protein
MGGTGVKRYHYFPKNSASELFLAINCSYDVIIDLHVHIFKIGTLQSKTIYSISLYISIYLIGGMLSDPSRKINACVLFSEFTLRTNKPNTCTNGNAWCEVI